MRTSPFKHLRHVTAHCNVPATHCSRPVLVVSLLSRSFSRSFSGCSRAGMWCAGMQRQAEVFSPLPRRPRNRTAGCSFCVGGSLPVGGARGQGGQGGPQWAGRGALPQCEAPHKSRCTPCFSYTLALTHPGTQAACVHASRPESLRRLY